MIRAISSSLFSALLLITMFWGGCVSCPQFFLFPKEAKKNCCGKSECERTQKSAPTKACKRMPIETQSSSSAGVALDAAVMAVPALPAPLPADRAATPVFIVQGGIHSPPDLNILHSTFLI